MALKIKTPNGMQKIDTNLHKPVIFINGTKYRLDKAWTFVNGVKQQIWGESGVQIDYIKSDGNAFGYLGAIGEDWAVSWLNGNAMRINISNFTNPQLIQSVAWGSVTKYNGFLSTTNNMVFGNGVNKITLNPQTGVLSAVSLGNSAQPGSLTLAYGLGITNSYFVQAFNLTKTFITTTSHGSHITTVTWGTEFYWSGTLKYTTGREPASATDTSGVVVYNNGMTPLQVGTNEIWARIQRRSGSSIIYDLYSLTYSGLTLVEGSSTLTGDLILDGNIICRNWFNGTTSGTSISGTTLPKTALSLLDKSTRTTLYTYDVPYVANTSNKNRLLFLGRIDNYYYVITMPYDPDATSGVKFVLLNAADLTVALEKALPSDPFNENEGKITFWYNAFSEAQISQTGFLGVYSYNSTTLKWRVARFSAVF